MTPIEFKTVVLRHKVTLFPHFQAVIFYFKKNPKKKTRAS
jgi:hypothetical protein